MKLKSTRFKSYYHNADVYPNNYYIYYFYSSVTKLYKNVYQSEAINKTNKFFINACYFRIETILKNNL